MCLINSAWSDTIHPYVMKSFAFKFPRVAHMGNRVSHAKNRTRRPFKYNLHTVTIVVDGVKKKMRVPTKVLRSLKKAGITTHYINISKVK